MDNKVYYGEYSLRHWIELICKGNIILPWYQRSFVWDKEQIERLIETYENNQFVPPVIIGAVKENDELTNYILDGQQRLTAILFALVGKYVDKKAWAVVNPDLIKEDEPLADDDVREDDDPEDMEIKLIRWNFNEIIKKKRIDSAELSKSYYKALSKTVTDNFFDNHYLGFAYIKPSSDIKEDDQSKFYSDTFRNINTGGTKLTRLETRKSLYFLKDELKEFFAPELPYNIRVKTSSKEGRVIDFIKYSSIIAQFRGYRQGLWCYGGRDWEKNEKYYREYIMAIVETKTDNCFGFDISYPTYPFTKERMIQLNTMIVELDLPKNYDSIIHLDIYFFGLIEQVIFENRKIDIIRKVELKHVLESKIQELENTENHKYYPGSLKYLKPRIAASREVYKEFALIENIAHE